MVHCIGVGGPRVRSAFVNPPALDLRDLDDALRAARSGGARAVEAACERVQTLRIEGVRPAAPARESVRWTVRVWGDGDGCAVASSSDAAASVDAALAALRDAALRHASPVDTPALYGARGLEDPRLGRITEADRLDVIASAERALGTHRRHALVYEESRAHRLWGNARGVVLHERGGWFSMEVAVDGPLGVTREGVATRRFADVASRPLGLAVRRRADVALRTAVLPREPTVLMEPRTFARVLDALACALAARPTPSWLTGDDVDPLPRALTVLDNATLRDGLRTYGFDERGVAPRPLPLLVAGVPRVGYRTVEDGSSTGHTGPDGMLRPSNVGVHPGIRTRNMLLAEMPHGVIVDVLPRFDPVRLVFAGEMRLCVLRAGERAGMVVQPVTLGLRELLGHLLEVGSDEERHAHVDAVSARFSPELLLGFARGG